MTVYIEYVLIDNFFIDYFLLKGAFYITNVKVKAIRLIAVSFLGAVISLFYPFLSKIKWLEILLKIPVGLLIVYLGGRYRNKREYFITFMLFLLFTFSVGGAITGIFYIFDIDLHKEYLIATIFIPACLMIEICVCFVKYTIKRKHVKDGTFLCKLKLNGKEITAEGFFDTGNGLYYNNLPVIVCSKKVAFKLMGNGLPKIFFIQVATVIKKDKMPAFTIDFLEIYTGDTPNIFKNITVVIGKNFGVGYDLILHPDLAGGQNDVFNRENKKIS